MKDNSHLSERVREDSEKLTPEKRARLLAAADRAPARREHGRMSIGTPSKVIPKAIGRPGPSE